MKTSFKGKTAFITGGASGIGLALCQQLKKAGATVIMTDTNQVALEKESERLGVQSHFLDVGDRKAFQDLVSALEAKGQHIDLLFNNAGIGVGGEVLDMTDEDWTKVIQVNLFGVIHGIQAVYPQMVKRGQGHILNVGSVAGLVAVPGEISYTTSKFAVVGLTQALRAEAAQYGVRVTLACPGVIETPIYKTSEIKGYDSQKVLDLWPKGISPQECAAQILEGVKNNQATVVITPFANALYALGRFSPDLIQQLGQAYMKKIKPFRNSPRP